MSVGFLLRLHFCSKSGTYCSRISTATITNTTTRLVLIYFHYLTCCGWGDGPRISEEGIPVHNVVLIPLDFVSTPTVLLFGWILAVHVIACSFDYFVYI